MRNRPTQTENLETRFFPLRYDGDRRVSGVVMQYGDVASLPWGEQERFEPGAFGDLSGADVILNAQHNRNTPLARTQAQGAGLVFSDTRRELRMAADIVDTAEANDVLTKIEAGLLRGFSVEFVVQESVQEKVPNDKGDMDYLTIIKRADLKGVGVVDRPAYSQSLIDARAEALKQSRSESEMDPKEIRALIEEMLAERAENPDQQFDLDRFVETVNGMVETAVADATTKAREEFEQVLQERDEAAAALAQAETEKAAAEERAEEERAAIVAEAEAKSDLVAMVRELLPEDTDTKSLTRHEIMVLAVGREVENAADRSEDYLLAKIEGIVERRSQAGQPDEVAARKVSPLGTGSVAYTGAPVNVNRAIVERQRQRMAQRVGR